MSAFAQYNAPENPFLTASASPSSFAMNSWQQSYPYQRCAHRDHATALHSKDLQVDALQHPHQMQEFGCEETYEQQSKQGTAMQQDRSPSDMECLTPIYGEDGRGAGHGGDGVEPGTLEGGLQILSYHVSDEEGFQGQVGRVSEESTYSSSDEAATSPFLQQQQNRQTLSHAGSMTTTTSYCTAAPAQPFLPSQRTPVTHTFPTNPQSSLARNAEAFRLRHESCIEIKRHLVILQDYFTHILRLKFEDVAPAAQQAAKHWVRSAHHWEITVSPDWKARLEKAPAHANPIQRILHRQIRIHAMMETERRKSVEMGRQSSGTAMVWRDDVSIAAFKKQLQLMKLWTSMFEAMLGDLKFRFPHFEDALREYESSGGWNQKLGDDGYASIEGL